MNANKVSQLRSQIQRGYENGRLGHFTYTYPSHKVYETISSAFDIQKIWDENPDSHVNLYFHIPFCRQRCTFCNLHMIKSKRENPLIDRYVTALDKEIELYIPILQNYRVDTIYFGGGTPSMLSPKQFKRVCQSISKLTDIQSVQEFTVEVAPDAATEDYLESLYKCGVTRISFGVQSVNQLELKKYGRSHTQEKVQSLIETTKRIGFETTNIDLIYGLTEQTVDGWRTMLQELLLHSPECISLYPLNIKPLTGLDRLAQKGHPVALDRHTMYQMYEAAVEILKNDGYEQDTRIRFLKTTRRYLHKTYTTSGGYVKGFGTAAQSYTEDWHYRPAYSYKQTSEDIRLYLDDVESGRFPVRFAYYLNEDEKRRRHIALNVRHKVFPVEYTIKKYGDRPENLFPEEFVALQEEGLLVSKEDRTELTLKGLKYCNLVSTIFFSEEVKKRQQEYMPI